MTTSLNLIAEVKARLHGLSDKSAKRSFWRIVFPEHLVKNGVRSNKWKNKVTWVRKIIERPKEIIVGFCSVKMFPIVLLQNVSDKSARFEGDFNLLTGGGLFTNPTLDPETRASIHTSNVWLIWLYVTMNSIVIYLQKKSCRISGESSGVF